MIITCAECNTQYYLAHQKLSPDGKKLKCSKCKTIWFQDYISSSEDIFDEIDTKSENIIEENKTFLPPALIEKKSSIWSIASIVVLSVIILVLTTIFFQDYFIKKYPAVSRVYDAMGIPSINGMKLHAVEISRNKNNQIDINAIIENNSKIYRRVPSVIIFLFDANNILLETIFIPAASKYLDKNGKYAFYRNIKYNFNTNPKVVSVALASGFEVFLYSLNFK